MKTLVYFAAFIFFPFYGISQSQKDNSILLKIKDVKIYKNDRNAEDGTRRLLCSISIVLINSSDKNICFFILGCGWEDAFVTNTCKLCFHCEDCMYNPCIITEIPPSKTLTYNGILNIQRGSENLDNIKFKIGFKYLNYEKYMFERCSGFSNYLNSDIIWSNEKTIRVNRLRNALK
ncbi:MAG: hypothetical protein WCQ95_08265 [Bacteroidota bacterium]